MTDDEWEVFFKGPLLRQIRIACPRRSQNWDDLRQETAIELLIAENRKHVEYPDRLANVIVRGIMNHHLRKMYTIRENSPIAILEVSAWGHQNPFVEIDFHKQGLLIESRLSNDNQDILHKLLDGESVRDIRNGLGLSARQWKNKLFRFKVEASAVWLRMNRLGLVP